ncbi:hypothetical protein N483_01260 [Pseudoalteromonas luteoviolacea NCIMB 1944]|nr:hypothetical protein N483_01260 [Pseudoalteromonas luteoviolacea NCIMB 1944]
MNLKAGSDNSFAIFNFESEPQINLECHTYIGNKPP